MNPIVAIVGRPNVGKSTLFNRLVGRKTAIVEDEPGVTRDRRYGDALGRDRTMTLVDTGGFVPVEKGLLADRIREQAQLAVEEADAVLFVVDGRTGINASDLEVAKYLRHSARPVVVAANKIDGERVEQRSLINDFFELGFDQVLPVSAAEGYGIDTLRDCLEDHLPTPSGEETASPVDGQETIRLAIVGRPNVGKSTLLNALLKKNRAIASEAPGTTRDPVDAELVHGGNLFRLTDTAGIRRKRSISQRLEHFAVLAALKALERSDVAALVLDATEPAVDQDAKIAELADDRGRAIILVINKWDLIEKPPKAEANFRASLKEHLRFVAYAPVIFTSAISGAKVEKILETAGELFREWKYRAPTPALNRLLSQITDTHPAPIARGKPLRLYYIAQVSVAPPTFMLTCNLPSAVPGSYKRYIANQLRNAFSLRVPIRLLFRARPRRARRSSR